MLYNLRQNLQVNQSNDAEERELIMRLAPLYQQDREQAIREGEQRGIQLGEQRGIQIGEQRGIQQGQRQLIENFLRVRFGELDEELSALIDPFLALNPEELSAIMLQLSTLSREELLGRFSETD
jgi:flagellar biosynthesis/type III secretory pathway protein FliH